MRKRWAMALVLFVLASAWFWRGRSPDTSVAAVPTAVLPETATRADAVAVGSATKRSDSSANVERQIEGDARMKLGDAFYDPKTPEELAWRLRHCYGSVAQRKMGGDRSYAGQPLRTGNLCSPVDIQHAGYLAMTSAGQREQALEFLQASAAAGSLNALEELSSVYAFISPTGVHDPVMSQAYARVAISRGDWGLAISNMRAPLDPSETILSEIYGQQIMQDLNRRRQRQGLPPLAYDPQPGMPSPDALREAMDRERNPARP